MDKIKIDGELYLGFIGGYLILLNTKRAVVVVYIKPTELLWHFLGGCWTTQVRLGDLGSLSCSEIKCTLQAPRADCHKRKTGLIEYSGRSVSCEDDCNSAFVRSFRQE